VADAEHDQTTSPSDAAECRSPAVDAVTRRLAALVRDSPDLVGVLDRDGTVRYLSPAALRVFTGAEPGAVALDGHLDLVNRADRRGLIESFTMALERPGVPVRLRLRARHQDGQWHFIEGTLTNALDDPDIAGVVLRCSDVTERAAMEATVRASERHHRRIVESLNEGIVLVDASGTVVACNTAATEILRLTRSQVTGRPVAESALTVLRADSTPCPGHETPINVTLTTGEPCQRVQLGLVGRDGDIRWVSVNTRVVDIDDAGEPALVVASFTDVTVEVLATQELELRLAIEHATAAISRDFLAHGAAVRQCTLDALAAIGPVAGATRAMVFALRDSFIDASRTLEWCAPGVEPATARFAGSRPSVLRTPRDVANRALPISSVASSPYFDHANRELLGSLTVRSMVMVPMVRDERTTGYVALHYADEREFAPSVLRGIEQFAAIVAAADAREEAELARARSDARLEGFLAGSYDVIIVIDAQANLLYATPRIEALLGRTADDLLGGNVIELVHPDDYGVALDALANNLNRISEGSPVDMRVRHADGHWIDVEVVGTNRLDDPAVEGIVVNVRDITERKTIEATLRDAEDRFEEVFEHAPNGMALTDSAGRVFRVNPAMCRMLGATVGELLGQSFAEMTHPDDRARSEQVHREMFGGTRTQATLEQRYRRIDGEYVWCRVHVSMVRDSTGAPRYCIAQINDITEQRTAAEILEYEARYDALTGLATRKLFLEQLERSIAATRRHGGLVAVLFIDLDHFKTVNDTMGHAAGDELLAAVARRMQSVLRAGDFACRFGGDEFMVLCTDLQSAADVADVAERLRDAIEHPFEIRGSDVFIGASIGIALADEAADASALLSQADSAAYRAKERGRNRYEVFDDELRATIRVRLETESALRRALDHDEMRLLFQPVINTATGAVDGFEALLRWERPGHGLVSPAGFLAVAEERGLIVPMGRHIIDAACRQIVAWEGAGAGGTTPVVAVNLSARQLAHPELVEHVAAILDATGAEPNRLCFELTETAVMDETSAAIATLHRLRAMGVDLAIDDFGTGYSSLSYLRRLPASVVKIDRSFVMELGASSQGSTIVASVIHMAHALGMRIVAEGVETIEHVAALVTLGCDQMQGFYFAPPLTPDAATDYLRTYVAKPYAAS
jgi:diguanylate cyclase (GGDEF)-like protein/PAS domain S-box-containing protein